MSRKPRAHRALHQAMVGASGSQTASHHGQPAAPHTSNSHSEASQPGNAAPPYKQPHGLPGTPETFAESGFLLDFRADSDQGSLGRLALAAVSNFWQRTGCAVHGAVSVARPDQTALTAGTSERAIGLARWDQGNGDGPVSQALSGRLAIILNDFSRDERWPGYWRPLREASYRSVVSVPLLLESGCSAALTLLSEQTNAFTPAVLADVVAFSEVAARSYLMAAAVRKALAKADQLHTALQGRTSIDVACGVIMAQNRCSYAEAFNILATASSHRNVKVRVLAESLLEDLPGGTPSTHFQR